MRREHEDRPPSGASPGQSETQEARPAEGEQLAALRRARQARVAKVLVILAIVVILMVFVIANSQPVKVNFVFLTRHPPLIWVMFACAILGGIAGYLIGKPGRQIRGRRRRGDQEDGPKESSR